MLRPAADADWQAVFGQPAPEHWAGLVADGAGMGGMYLAQDGRWWATFLRFPGVTMAKTAHKAALWTLDAARVGDITLHAIADQSIEGSEFWLRRLGFRPTEEHIEGHQVYQWIP